MESTIKGRKSIDIVNSLLIIAIMVMQSGCTERTISAEGESNKTNKSGRLISKPKLTTELSNEEIANIGNLITVKIEGAVEGSGVIVSKELENYKVITAWHVIKSNQEGEEINIVTNDGLQHTTESGIYENFGDIDLVEINFSSKQLYKTAVLADPRDAKPGQKTFITGYPLATLAVPKRIERFTEGKIIANTSTKIRKGYQLLYSNNTMPGMSGGGIFNIYGQLIGIHGQAELDEQSTKNSGMIVKSGINQGIPINYYTDKFDIEYKAIEEKKDASYYLAQINYLNSIEPPPSGGRYVFSSNGKEQEIVELANKGLELDPNNHHLINSRGTAKLNIPSAALQKYANAWIEIGMDYRHPKYQSIYATYIQTSQDNVYNQTSDINAMESLVDFKMAYKYKPDFVKARINASIVYDRLAYKLKNDDYRLKAIEEINKAQEYEPKEAELFIINARYKLANKNYKGCNDYVTALTLGNILAARSILGSMECESLGSTAKRANFNDALNQLNQIIEFNKPLYTHKADANDHLVIPKDRAFKFYKSSEYQAYQNTILAIFTRGVVKWLYGDKSGACSDLNFSYHPSNENGVIMSIPIDSFRAARFDVWNFNNICNFSF
jgi:V8-like Glu-specific endopeptidase